MLREVKLNISGTQTNPTCIQTFDNSKNLFLNSFDPFIYTFQNAKMASLSENLKASN